MIYFQSYDAQDRAVGLSSLAPSLHAQVEFVSQQTETQGPVHVMSRARKQTTVSVTNTVTFKTQLTMSSHRHQSSLERVLDFSEPLLLSPQQNEFANILLDSFIEHYGPERATQKGYKPARLIRVTFDHIISKDSFLTFFFTYLHESVVDIDSNLDSALLYFKDFTSWESAAQRNVTDAIEEFADYLVTQFFLPRMSAFQHCAYESILTYKIFSQSVIGEDTTADSHITVRRTNVHANGDNAAHIFVETRLSCPRSPPMCCNSKI